MDYELTITILDQGRDPEAGGVFLDAFQATHPETDPVVTQNLKTGELSIVLSIDAPDATVAFDIGRPIVTGGIAASQRNVTVVMLHVERATADVTGDELVGA